ncbi:MAG: hypothetical protein ACOYK6_00005 [Chthoniobacterales bacterium]
MSNISSNLSSPTPQLLSGTQENEIVQKKSSKTASPEKSTALAGAANDRNIKTNSDYSERNSSDAISQNHESSQDDARNLGSSSSATPNEGTLASSVSESQGESTAHAAFAAQFQTAGSKFVNSSTLSPQATDYISKNIQDKVSLNSVTLKMQTTVPKNSYNQSVTILNHNRAPLLPEPTPLVIEPDPSEDNNNQTDETTVTNRTPSKSSRKSTASTLHSARSGSPTASTSTSYTVSTYKATTPPPTNESSDSTPLSTTTETAQDTFNVFIAAESSAQLSTHSQLEAIDASVAGSNADENIQLDSITKEQTQITATINNAKAEAAANAASRKSQNTSNTTGWVVNSLMFAAGFLLSCTVVGAGLGVALMIGAALSMVMMSPGGKDITNDLTKSLEGPPCHASHETADIVSQIIIASFIIACSGIGEGLAAVFSDAIKAAMVGAETTTDVASISTSSGADITADSTADSTTDADEGFMAGSSRDHLTPEDMTLVDGVRSTSQWGSIRALNAFGYSLARSARIGTRSLKLAIFEAPALVTSGIYNTAIFPIRMAGNILDFVCSVFYGLFQFLKESAEFGMSLAQKSTFEEVLATISESAQETASLTVAKIYQTIGQLFPRTLVNGVFILVAALNTLLSLHNAKVAKQSLIAAGNFEQSEGNVKIDEAFVSEMQSFIESSNNSLTNILNTVENEVTNAGATLSQMASPLETALRS